MQKILIADDSPELLDVLSMLFAMYHFETATVLSGQATFNKMQSWSPDLILLDVMLGGSDGRQICWLIKQTNPHIPVILFSASPELLIDFKHCLADAIIEKPFDIQFVIQEIKRLL